MKEPVTILVGDVVERLRELPAACVQCCVTSPPYWGLRDYGVEGHIGLEETPEAYVEKMVEVFREVWRVLRDDGTLWLNLGDSYANSQGQATRGGPPSTTSTLEGNGHRGGGRKLAALRRIRAGTDCDPKRGDAAHGQPRHHNAHGKSKDLMMMPYRVALALQADGWYLRSVICWAKKSPMPESVRDRPTSSWEPIFLMAKSERYFYDAEAVKEQGNPASADRYKYAFSGAKDGLARPDGGERMVPDGIKRYDGTRNQRNVWHLGPEPYKEAHFATFPTEIPRRAILAGTSEKGCCAACGTPWKRVVARSTNGMDEVNGHERDGDTTDARGGKAKCPSGLVTASRTTGWEPGCKCGGQWRDEEFFDSDFAGGGTRRIVSVYVGGADTPIPCVVLDPFLGSGTTVAVARTLGRHGVGIELNPAYVQLAKDRIGKAEKPHTHVRERGEASELFSGLKA